MRGKVSTKRKARWYVVVPIVLGSVILASIIGLFILFANMLSETAKERGVDGRFSYAYSKKLCFIHEYNWDGDMNNTEIHIPETVNSIKVTDIGGYLGRGLPMPFEITGLPEPDPSDTRHPQKAYNIGSYPQIDVYGCPEYSFTVYIGPNIKSAQYEPDYYLLMIDRNDSENSECLYRVTHTYIIDENNKYLKLSAEGYPEEK